MKYLKIREQKEKHGTKLYFELVDKKDEKECYYVEVKKLKKTKKDLIKEITDNRKKIQDSINRLRAPW